MRKRHEQELRAFFSGEFTADMGLRSAMGAALDRAESHAASEHAPRAPQWDGRSRPPDEPVACNPTRAGASTNSTEMPETALAAVRRERHVRNVLVRLLPEDVRVLRAYCEPAAPCAPSGALAVVAMRLGSEGLRALALAAQTKLDPDLAKDARAEALARRARAKDRLAAETRMAQHAIVRALDAYVAEADAVRRAGMEERAMRWVRGLT